MFPRLYPYCSKSSLLNTIWSLAGDPGLRFRIPPSPSFSIIQGSLSRLQVTALRSIQGVGLGTPTMCTDYTQTRVLGTYSSFQTWFRTLYTITLSLLMRSLILSLTISMIHLFDMRGWTRKSMIDSKKYLNKDLRTFLFLTLSLRLGI